MSVCDISYGGNLGSEEVLSCDASIDCSVDCSYCGKKIDAGKQFRLTIYDVEDWGAMVQSICQWCENYFSDSSIHTIFVDHDSFESALIDNLGDLGIDMAKKEAGLFFAKHPAILEEFKARFQHMYAAFEEVRDMGEGLE